ncbi:hypothetical protein LSAT2_024924, partial [Lamellibrachia satsuma]
LKDICAVIIHSEKSRKTYKDATRQDPQLQDLLVHVRKGWPSFTVGGKDYMVSVDYYSKWINITELKATKSADVIEALQRQFADFGIPEELVSDNGPQFGSWEFR